MSDLLKKAPARFRLRRPLLGDVYKKYLILMKFHDLMSVELIESYKQLAVENENIIFEEERNIIKFLLMADIVTRMVFINRDLKLGVVTALVGAPFFLWLLIKSRKTAWS